MEHCINFQKPTLLLDNAKGAYTKFSLSIGNTFSFPSSLAQDGETCMASIYLQLVIFFQLDRYLKDSKN